MQGEQKDKKQALNITAFSYQGGEACDSQDINVFVLFHDKDKKRVNDMQAELANKKILLTKGLAETTEAYGEKGDIIKYYDYFAVIISKPLLEDIESLKILLENYKTDASKKMLPMIVWKALSEPAQAAWHCALSGFRLKPLLQMYAVNAFFHRIRSKISYEAPRFSLFSGYRREYPA